MDLLPREAALYELLKYFPRDMAFQMGTYVSNGNVYHVNLNEGEVRLHTGYFQDLTEAERYEDYLISMRKVWTHVRADSIPLDKIRLSWCVDWNKDGSVKRQGQWKQGKFQTKRKEPDC